MIDYQFILSHGGNEYTLTTDPDGWEEITINLNRDSRWHGVFKEISLDLGFWCNGGGYEFINSIYESNGADAEILLTISYCDTVFFTGLLALNSIIRKHSIINVPVDNYDVGVLIKRRFETPINLEQATTLDGGTVNNYTYGNYDVGMHSRTIFLQSELRQDDPFTRQTTQAITFGIQYGAWINHGILSTLNDLSTIQDNPVIVDFRTGGSFLRSDSNIEPFFTANDPIVQYPLVVDLSWDISGVYTDTMATPQTRGFNVAGQWILQLHYGQDLATGTQIQLAATGTYASNDPTITRPFSGSGSQQITLEVGDRIWLAWGITGGNYLLTTGSGTFDIDFSWAYDSAFVKLETNSQFEETETKAWAIHELFARLTHSITNIPISFFSRYFGRTNSQPTTYPTTGDGGLTAITNGLKLRGYTDERSAIAVSMQDLMESVDSLHCVGWGVENNKMVVETIDYFYSDNVIAQFDFVPEVEMRIFKDAYYNEVEIGYEKWETEDVNGIEEPNSIHTYSIPNTQLKNKYVRLSPYIGGSYAIETTRRRRGSTRDWKYDNDNFILALKPVLTECEKDENFDSVTNLLEPSTTYNLRYSPARNLVRHLKAVVGALFRKPTAEVRFQEGEGNIEMTSRELDNRNGYFNNQLLTENQDFIAGQSLWIPEVYSFEFVVEFTQFMQIANDPYGKIGFSETDTDHKYGYILTMEYDLKHSLAKFELLRAND